MANGFWSDFRRFFLRGLAAVLPPLLTVMIIVFVFTRKLALAIEVGAVEVTAKLLLYYFHERIWGFIGWGKPKHPLEGLKVTRDLEPEHLEEIKGRLEDLGYL